VLEYKIKYLNKRHANIKNGSAEHAARSRPCFIVLPGLAPDPLSVVPIKTYLEKRGYPAIVSNFCGDLTTTDFSKLRIEDCLQNLGALIKEARRKYSRVGGIGISLGGALLIEHAKTNSDLDFIVSIGTPFKLRKARLISLSLPLAPILHPIWKFFDEAERARPLPVEALPMAMRFFEGRFLENLDRVKSSVLFMHGKKDPATHYQALLRYVPEFSNARTKVVLSEDGDHQMNYDLAAITRGVFDFLGLPGESQAGLAISGGE